MHRFIMMFFPRRFRESWSVEVGRTRAQVLGEARSRGPLALARAHLWVAADALRALPSAWRDTLVYAPAVVEGALPANRGALTLDALRDDMRFTLRQWRGSPAFTFCALTTLSLGMGVAIAIFAVVYAVLLRPMSYRAPEQVAIAVGASQQDFPRFAGTPIVEDVVAWRSWRAGLRENDGSVGVRLSAAVGANYFDVLGVRPAVGRFIGGADSAAGDWNGIVLSWNTWQHEFNGRADIIGTRLSIDTTVYTVAGVTASNFTDPLGMYVNDLETAFYRLLRPNERRGFAQAVIRLRPGVTAPRAQLLLAPLVGQPPLPPSAVGLPQALTRPKLRVQQALSARTDAVKPTLYILAAAAALMLVIGCANTANLLFTRSTTRHAELMVRAALGASRRRLIRQLLTESLMLAAVAAVIGTALGFVGARMLVAFAGDAIPRGSEVALHPAVIAFTVAMALMTALMSGLLPAIRDSAAGMAAGTREFARGVLGARSGKRIRGALVVAQVALAVVLASGAGLLIRSLWLLETIKTGFDAEPVLTVRVTFPMTRVPPPQLVQRHRDILAALQREPDVRGAAAVSVHPLTGGGSQAPVVRMGQEPSTDKNDLALVRPVLGDYFGVMGIRLIAGHPLPATAASNTEPVAVLSTSLARRLFGDEVALDRMVAIGKQNYRVIGVANEVREYALDAPVPGTIYMSYEQAPVWTVPATSTFLVRASVDGHTLVPSVRAAIRSVDANLPVAFWRTMRDMMDENLLAPRLRAILIGTFGIMAALLAIIGLTGAMAYTVSQTLPEIGVRIALGATGRQVSGLVLRDAGMLTGIGLVIGVAGTLAATGLLRSMVFEIAPNDPTVIGVVAGTTLLTALLASWIPAHRAGSVDPATVLRGQ